MSQNKQILEYLEQGNTLTALEALEKFDCFRLASRINQLINKPYCAKIMGEPRHNFVTNKTYSEYFMFEIVKCVDCGKEFRKRQLPKNVQQLTKNFCSACFKKYDPSLVGEK